MDNAFQKVTIRRDGTFDVIDKDTKRTFRGLGVIEDVEDSGDGYTCIRFEKPGKPVTSKGIGGKARILSHDALSTAVEVALGMKVPAELTPDRKSRSRRTVTLPVRIPLRHPALPQRRPRYCDGRQQGQEPRDVSGLSDRHRSGVVRV